MFEPGRGRFESRKGLKLDILVGLLKKKLDLVDDSLLPKTNALVSFVGKDLKLVEASLALYLLRLFCYEFI